MEIEIDFWSKRKSDSLSEEGWSHNSTKRFILSGRNVGLRCSGQTLQMDKPDIEIQLD